MIITKSSWLRFAFLVGGLNLLCTSQFSFAEKVSSAQTASPAWTSVRSFAIQLQNGKPEELARSPFQMIVMDPTRDGTDATSYTPAEIQSIRAGNNHKPKLVLGYLSVGEAENYRSYWQKDWKHQRPEWIGPQDPDWKGDFKVKFWEAPWHTLMEKEVDRLIDQGFDGVFLDVVDAGEFWADPDRKTAQRPTAEREMVDFVKSLAAYAHKRNPSFGIFPNGAENLGRFHDYVATVSGIFREDIWYYGNRPNKPSEIKETLAALEPFQKAHKPIFAIDYVTQPDKIDDFYAKAKSTGFIPYATVRNLEKLTINPGHDDK